MCMRNGVGVTTRVWYARKTCGLRGNKRTLRCAIEHANNKETRYLVGIKCCRSRERRVVGGRIDSKCICTCRNHEVGEVVQTLMGVARSRQYHQSPQPGTHSTI